MEEMLTTYQDALHALSDMQDILDTIDSDEISAETFDLLLESYIESRDLFLNFLADYIENICAIPLESPTSDDILHTAQKEKIITGKEFKYLSAHLENITEKNIKESEEDAHDTLETFTSLYEMMRDILEGIEI
ncbi:MAG: hypothetical protein AB7F19_04875 [Candidatus Babeliales bacterium]